jgi:hypothetical protein
MLATPLPPVRAPVFPGAFNSNFKIERASAPALNAVFRASAENTNPGKVFQKSVPAAWPDAGREAQPARPEAGVLPDLSK